MSKFIASVLCVLLLCSVALAHEGSITFNKGDSGTIYTTWEGGAQLTANISGMVPAGHHVYAIGSKAMGSAVYPPGIRYGALMTNDDAYAGYTAYPYSVPKCSCVGRASAPWYSFSLMWATCERPYPGTPLAESYEVLMVRAWYAND